MMNSEYAQCTRTSSSGVAQYHTAEVEWQLPASLLNLRQRHLPAHKGMVALGIVLCHDQNAFNIDTVIMQQKQM